MAESKSAALPLGYAPSQRTGPARRGEHSRANRPEQGRLKGRLANPVEVCSVWRAEGRPTAGYSRLQQLLTVVEWKPPRGLPPLCHRYLPICSQERLAAGEIRGQSPECSCVELVSRRLAAKRTCRGAAGSRDLHSLSCRPDAPASLRWLSQGHGEPCRPHRQASSGTSRETGRSTVRSPTPKCANSSS